MFDLGKILEAIGVLDPNISKISNYDVNMGGKHFPITG